MKPLFWQEILEALENELTPVSQEEVPVETPAPDSRSAEDALHTAEDAVTITENPVAKAADEAAPKRRLIDDPKKLVIFSEIMKPKFND